MQEMQVWSLGQEGPLEKEMAIHSSILTGKSLGQRNLVGYSPWGHKKIGHDLVTKQQPYDTGQVLLMHYSTYSHNSTGEYYDYPSYLD